ncbi:uncharacterized protein LOC106155919 isoform X2 [Lingula anatina]|uniref:Uncharacterized protein LOC106155919 isoform X2 n=1 Tax=Lingula anatina TaxID=7574 RepID=A0A1S3HJW3_LINAN|nr:uncharacterized protein LOC106155919 isoform X2 [Lingula anatina]|eukprot:XP_013386410.1 uncharacterized protein LOC106155919 isoform X2 [Lingula anatina]
MDADKDAAHLAAKLSTFLEQQLQGFEKKTKISRQKKSRSAPILGHIDPLPKPKADRARPIKPHENSPFLGINLLPPEKQAAEAEPSQLRQKSNRLNVPLSRPGSTTTRATRASQTGRVTSAASTRRAPSRQSRAAAYGSVAGDFIKFPNAVPFHKSPVVTVHPKANKHIKSPFKQNANTIELEVSNVAPGQDLKEKTALATYHVSRVLAQQPVKQETKHFGRLRKGKLKPLLEPVVLDGPSIEQCRGIVADAHCYMASPSKSSLRREQLLNSLTKDYIRERPRTAESMHHTSEASDTEDRQRELEEDYDDFEEEEPEDEDYVDYDVELDENVVPPNGYNVDMSHIPGAEMSEENLMTAEQEKESDINNLHQIKESPEQDMQVPTEAVLGVTVTNQQKPRVGSAKTILRDPNRPVTANEEIGRRGSAKTVRFKDFSSEADTKAGGDMLVQQVTSSLVIEQSEVTSPQGLSHSDTAQSSNEKYDSKVSEQGDVIKEKDQGQKNDVNTGAEHSVPNSETTTDSQGVAGIESLKEVAVEEKSETDDKKSSGKVSCKDDVVDESVKKDRDDDNDDDLSHYPSNQNDGKSSTCRTQAPAFGGNNSITDQVNGGTDTKGGGNSDCDSKGKQNTDNQRKESGSELSGKIDESEKQNPNVITQEQFQSYIRGHAEMALQFSQFLIDKNHYQKFTRRPNSASMNVRSRPSSGKKDSLRKRPLSAGANKCNSSSQNQGRASPRRTQRPGSSSSAGKRPGSRIGFTSPDRPRSPEKDQRWVSTSKSQKSSPRKVDSLKPTVSKPPTGAENKQLKTGRRSRTRCQQKKLSPKKENLHLKQGDIFLHSSRVSDPMSNSRTGHGTRESSRANLHIDLSNIDDEGCGRAYTMDHETYEGTCGICGLEADMCICPNSTLKSNHGEIAKAAHDEILEDFDDDELGIYEDSGESDAESENVDTILTLEEMENSLSQVQLDINRKCVGLEKMNRIIESSFSMGEYDIEGMEDPDMLKLDIDSVIKEMAPEVISGGAASYREDTERFWMSTDCKRLLASYRYKCMTGGTDCAEMSSSLVVPNSNRHNDGAEDTVVFLSSRKQDGITEEKVLYSSRQEKQMDTIDLVARETAMRNQGSAETSIHERKTSQSDQPKSCQSLAWNQSCDNVSDSGCGSEVEQSLLDDYEGLSRGGSAADSVVDKDDAESKNKVSTPAEEDSRPDVTGLKVIATTKTLSAPSRCDKNLEDDHTPVAPYPPICFRINAKPPEGHMYYFAYGTDMNPNRFGTYIRKKACTRLWGLLFGFQLKFNKRGADIEAGGFPNIEFNPFSSVEGVVYTITQSELALLDQCTGYPEHYEHVMVPVWMCNSSDPSTLGVAQYCVPAVTYVAQDKWITREDYPLEFEYNLHQCLKSCDMLSPAYKQHLFQMQGSAQVW